MSGWLGRLFGGGGREKTFTAAEVRQKVRASWDAAKTTTNNQNHWANADNLSPDAAVKVAVRKELRERARYEVANNCYARGMVNTLANDAIGTGPHLQMVTDDEDFNAEVEEIFSDWAKEIKLREKMITGRKARTESGEVFFVFITNDKLKSPIKLDVKVVESDQCTDEDGLGSGNLLKQDNADGIKYDKAGNPVSYRILPAHPGNDTQLGDTQKVTPTPASKVVHMYREDRPGQPRGVPEIAPALPLFAIMRRYTLACVAAAETAANNSYTIHTQHPSLDADSVDFDVAPFEVVDMERNMATVLPAGWQATQMRAEQPTDTYPDFKKEILNEVARCLDLPYNVAAGNSSSYNYASGRLDHQSYHKDLEIEQAYQEDTLLVRLFEEWMEEAVRAQVFTESVIPDMDDLHLAKEWFWDGQGHIDPVREAKAQEIRLKNNITSLAIECSKEGNDWRTVVDQRGRERRLLEDEGLEKPLATDQLESDDYGGSDETYFLPE